MILKRSLVAGSVLLIPLCAQNARIDLDGSDTGVQFEIVSAAAGVNASHPNWLSPDKQKKKLTCEFPAQSAWLQMVFSFRADRNGEVFLYLKGPYATNAPYIAYDDVTIDGATVINGDFENPAIKDNTGKTGWVCGVSGSHRARYITVGAHGGDNCVLANHNANVYQRIAVKKGVAVNVATWVRLPDAMMLSSQERVNQFADGIVSDTKGWYPLVPDIAHPPAGVDVLSLAWHRPAGKFGRMKTENGHFSFEKQPNVPVKIWGVNLTDEAALPKKEEAEGMARHLSALGFTVVRFHHINKAITVSKANDTGAVDPEMLDRFEYFVYQLKRYGIYINFNLLTNRWDYKEGDGVPEYKSLDKNNRTVHFFERRLIELLKDFARTVLDHTNPYTKMRNADDPAFAVVEIINETSFFGSGETGENSRLPPGYAAKLTALFNAWLKEKYATSTALTAAWGGLDAGESLEQGTVERRGLFDDARSAERRRDTALFYMQTERSFYREIISFLRERLGFRGIINGTNNWYGILAVRSQIDCDYLDIHGYFSHPVYTLKGRVDTQNFYVQQFSAVNYPEGYCLEYPLAWPNILPTHKWQLGAVAGKPIVSSEWNSPHPNIYAYETPLLVAAYGSLQGVDGLYLFTYNNVHAAFADGKATRGPGFFDLPATIYAQLPLASLTYLRGDVSPAKHTVVIPLTDRAAADAFLTNDKAFSHNARVALPLSVGIVHKIRKAFDEKDGKETAFETPANPYRSDTRELLWDDGGHEKGLFTVASPRMNAAVGMLSKHGDIALPAMTVRSSTDAAVGLISLDGLPLETSKRMLLTAAARMEYTGQVWKPGMKSTYEFGEFPALAEPIRATVTIPRARKAAAVGCDGSERSVAVRNGMIDLNVKAPWIIVER